MKKLLCLMAVMLLMMSRADAQSLQDSVVAMAHAFKGDVGIFAIDLENGDTVSYNADKMFPTASVIKIYVLAKLYQEVEQGKLAMTDQVTLHDSDKVPGSGILLFMHACVPKLVGRKTSACRHACGPKRTSLSGGAHTDTSVAGVPADALRAQAGVPEPLWSLTLHSFSDGARRHACRHDGLKLTLSDLSWLMINMSDNVAANLLTDEVGGVMKVTDYIRSLGLTRTMELAKIFDRRTYPDSALRKIYGIGVTTPRETAIFMKELYRGKIVDPKSSEAMINVMKYQFYNTSIPRFLPTYRDTIEIAHKTGALDDTRNDCAIVYTPRTNYVLCVFTTNNKDRRWITDNSAEVFIAKVSLLIYDHFVK